MGLGNHQHNTACPCGSQRQFLQCCSPFIEGLKKPVHPEQLMRSRYSAYVVGNYDYIQQTYSSSHKDVPSVADIALGASNTQWLKLFVHASHRESNQGQVEFRAFYKAEGRAYQLHENSDFLLENSYWKYSDGHILDDSGAVSLNGDCFCGSGKKLKRCCLKI